MERGERFTNRNSTDCTVHLIYSGRLNLGEWGKKPYSQNGRREESLKNFYK